MTSLQIASEWGTSDMVGIQPDRRIHPRYFWQGTAVIRILPYGPDVLGAVMDFSDGGCGIELGMDMPAEVGAHVEVDMNVRGAALRRMGVLRRIDVIRRIERETRAGIEFIDGKGAKARQARFA
jgi:hypothetical protein